jgi:two-component system KDP operon response regulator KdpE
MTGAPLSVLVVDDEPPIRKLLRLGLAAHGYQVLEAPNGKTALELLGKAPDLIILDLGLPDTQGHDLLRTIRARNERVPIVVLSSRGDEAGKVQALDLGADDYVTKPFGMDELLARMRAALSARSSASVSCRSIWSAASSRPATRRSSCRRRNTICCECWFSMPARC